MYGHDLGHSFAQSADCSHINAHNVRLLHPKWFLPAADSVTASPTVVDDVVYVGSWDGTFYAIPADAEFGIPEPLWTFQIDDTSGVAFGRIVSSAAVADVAGTGVVAFGGGATLYVLDAATGTELASICVDPRTDPPPPADPIRCRGSDGEIEIESSPAFVDVAGETRILVGMDVHNDPGVGRTGLIALRLAAAPWRLEPVWKLDPETGLSYTTDASHAGDPAFVVTADPLTQGAGTGSGCGGVWSSPAVDVAGGLVFFGTANCEADAMPPGESGGEALIAADLASGALRWRWSPRGLNRLDDDFGASPNLLPGGLVGIGGKDGAYAALTRTGAGGQPQLVWRTLAGLAGHVTVDFAVGGIIGTPAVGLARGEPAIFVTTALSTPFAGPLDTDGPVPDPALFEDPGRLFSLHALSATDGRLLWRSPVSRQSYGAPTYARGLLFVPSTFDASVKVFRASTGRLVHDLHFTGAVSSAPAVVGDSIYFGTGTRETDLEFKTFGGEDTEPVLGEHVLSRLSGVWAFEVPAIDP